MLAGFLIAVDGNSPIEERKRRLVLGLLEYVGGQGYFGGSNAQADKQSGRVTQLPQPVACGTPNGPSYRHCQALHLVSPS